MTDEALRAARIAEARRRHVLETRPLVEHLADIYETNWTPPEPVDPDLLAAREWYAAKTPDNFDWQTSAREGRLDKSTAIQSYLAGCARGREGAKGLVEVLETVDRAMEIVGAGAVILQITTADRARIKSALASAKRGG